MDHERYRLSEACVNTVLENAVRLLTLFPRMHLTYSPATEKGPRYKNWNDPATAIRTVEAAREHWTKYPHDGMGMLLGPSGVVSLDIDHPVIAQKILLAFGIELDVYREYTPTIIGNPLKYRLTFAAPEGVALSHRTCLWPKESDPSKAFAIFEFRAGVVSDQLPPSPHPSGSRYRWALPPKGGFPTLPPEVLRAWLTWPEVEPTMRAMCPWWKPAPVRIRERRTPIAPADSVIAKFNEAHDPVEIIQRAGYKRIGKRFASPDTQHAPGIVQLQSGKLWCHHQGDPLSGDKPRDAFDCYAILEHGGNVSAAVKEAARMLGMERAQ